MLLQPPWHTGWRHPEWLRCSPCTIHNKPTYQEDNRIQKRDKFSNNETRTRSVSGACLALVPSLPGPLLANKSTNDQRGRAGESVALHVHSGLGYILLFSSIELRELGLVGPWRVSQVIVKTIGIYWCGASGGEWLFESKMGMGGRCGARLTLRVTMDQFRLKFDLSRCRSPIRAWNSHSCSSVSAYSSTESDDAE